MHSMELLNTGISIQPDSIHNYIWVISLIILFFKDCFVSVNFSAVDKINLGALTFQFHYCRRYVRIMFPQALLS